MHTIPTLFHVDMHPNNESVYSRAPRGEASYNWIEIPMVHEVLLLSKILFVNDTLNQDRTTKYNNLITICLTLSSDMHWAL